MSEGERADAVSEQVSLIIKRAEASFPDLSGMSIEATYTCEKFSQSVHDHL